MVCRIQSGMQRSKKSRMSRTMRAPNCCIVIRAADERKECGRLLSILFKCFKCKQFYSSSVRMTFVT